MQSNPRVGNKALTLPNFISHQPRSNPRYTSLMSHDASYKLLFSHARMVADLLRGFVPADWVEQLNLESLERVSGSYVSADLRDRHNDVVWRLRWGPRWLYVYLLIEFQSSVVKGFLPLPMTFDRFHQGLQQAHEDS